MIEKHTADSASTDVSLVTGLIILALVELYGLIS